jgi:hypothetical protein
MSAAQLAALARTSDPHTMLRRFLALDAAVTGVNGLVYLLAAGPVGRFLGVGSGLLAGLGAFLVAYAPSWAPSPRAAARRCSACGPSSRPTSPGPP